MTAPMIPATRLAFAASQRIQLNHLDPYDLTHEDVLSAVNSLRHLPADVPADLLADWWEEEGHTGSPRANGWLYQHHGIRLTEAEADAWHETARTLLHLRRSFTDPATVLPLLATDLPEGAILIAAAALTYEEAQAVADGITPVDLPAWSTLAAMAGYRLPAPDAVATSATNSPAGNPAPAAR